MSTEPTTRDRLGPDDWVEAALAAMATGGVDQVRVDVLSRRLGITRGSFYWHFKDRRALLAAMLAAWQAAHTDDVIARVEASDDPPAIKLLRLLRFCFDDDGRLETAFRGWAARDAEVADAVRAVDDRRTGYIADLLVAIGLDTDLADRRARLAYRAWLGGYALCPDGRDTTRADEAAELHALLTMGTPTR